MGRLLFLLAAVCLTCSCDDGGGGAAGESRGTATVTLDYGGGDVRTLTKDASVTVREPVRHGSVSETNAIHLSMGTLSSSTASEGDFLMLSAGEFQVDLGPTPAILQFWSLTVDGSSVTGSLTDTHSAEAMAANQLWATDTLGGAPLTTGVYPYMMATGTTVSGTADGAGARLVLQGRAVAPDGLSEVLFRIDVATSR
ncbi:MAG: hypothetical protein AMXMBFR64_03160 [Myxococcales bacterium]